jgi:hypothetical protein
MPYSSALNTSLFLPNGIAFSFQLRPSFQAILAPTALHSSLDSSDYKTSPSRGL